MRVVSAARNNLFFVAGLLPRLLGRDFEVTHRDNGTIWNGKKTTDSIQFICRNFAPIIVSKVRLQCSDRMISVR